MSNVTIGTGITTNGQFPVDGKVYFLTLSDASDLGNNDVLAYSYYERMKITIVENGSEWEWREEGIPGETGGLLTTSFTYPSGLISNGIDYSNRIFNFFPRTVGSVDEPQSQGSFVRNYNGVIYTWVTLNTTDDLAEGTTNLYLSSQQQTKLGYITISAPVDLDILVSDVSNNSLKISAEFASALDSNLAMANSVGSIPAGTTIGDLNGDSITSLFEQLLFPTIPAYIADPSNLSSSGFSNSLVEVGTSYSFTLNMSFDTGEINNGDNTLAGPVSGDAISFIITLPDLTVDYNNTSVVSNSASHTTTGYSLQQGSNVWTFSATNASSSTTYIDNKGGTDTITSIENAKADTIPDSITLSKNAVFPYIWGQSGIDFTGNGSGFYDAIGSGMIKEIVSEDSSKQVTFNASGQFLYFGYPAFYGLLTSIRDVNNFEVFDSFERLDETVVSSGLATNWSEPYYIYKIKALTSSTDPFTFNQ